MREQALQGAPLGQPVKAEINPLDIEQFDDEDDELDRFNVEVIKQRPAVGPSVIKEQTESRFLKMNEIPHSIGVVPVTGESIPSEPESNELYDVSSLFPYYITKHI
jgi:hypothetical protein